MAVQSNCVNVKSVNYMTACNTNTINVTHAENVCIQNTTHVHFPNVIMTNNFNSCATYIYTCATSENRSSQIDLRNEI